MIGSDSTQVRVLIVSRRIDKIRRHFRFSKQITYNPTYSGLVGVAHLRASRNLADGGRCPPDFCRTLDEWQLPLNFEREQERCGSTASGQVQTPNF
jgi:hypothetical protein